MKILLALDQGTTSSRAIAFSPDGSPVSQAQQEFEQIFPQPGWVEHNPDEIWSTTAGTMAQALSEARIGAGDILAAGITNQRETTIVWDRRTGQPVYNAIVWQDRRTAGLCGRLRADGVESAVQEKTGLLLDPYFSGTKLKWILDNVDGARARAARGDLAFGTVDTWLVWNLTGGRLHLTDVSNASRTLLFNIHTGGWDDELLRILDVPREVLPEVRASSEVYGEISQGPAGAPLAAVCGDQQAALFGQACFVPGLTKVTYGTGCFLLQYTGDKPVPSANRLLTTAAWQSAGGPLEYALEGSVFIGGAVVQWFRDGLGLIRSSGDIEPLAASVADSGGVFLVPAFAGLGAPHWDPYARGLIIGLTRGTTAAHLARATVESIAFQVADLLDAMRRDSGIELRELRVDGGAARNNLLMQFQADLLGAPVVRPATTELTALGAAWLAGLATGAIKDRTQVAALWRADRSFEPSMPRGRARDLIAGWGRAVERAQKWES